MNLKRCISPNLQTQGGPTSRIDPFILTKALQPLTSNLILRISRWGSNKVGRVFPPLSLTAGMLNTSSNQTEALWAESSGRVFVGGVPVEVFFLPLLTLWALAYSLLSCPFNLPMTQMGQEHLLSDYDLARALGSYLGSHLGLGATPCYSFQGLSQNLRVPFSNFHKSLLGVCH